MHKERVELRTRKVVPSQWLCAMLLILCCLPMSAIAQMGDGQRPAGLQTVSFFSESLGREVKYDIVLPPDHDSSDRRYPVLYLLHGFMQNYTVWGRSLGAAERARDLGDLIVVMPDGGNSWYVNYHSANVAQPESWEHFIVDELIADVDSRFPTHARREGRAIAGLSMGGYGALMLALRHPQLFVSAASSSGALGWARERAQRLAAGELPQPAQAPQMPPHLLETEATIAALIDIPGFGSQLERTPQGIAFHSADEALAHDPFQLIYQVPMAQLPHFYLDAGTSDRLIQVTREFMQILLLNNVPFDYMQGHGGHNAAYWHQSLGHFLPLQREVMTRALQTAP